MKRFCCVAIAAGIGVLTSGCAQQNDGTTVQNQTAEVKEAAQPVPAKSAEELGLPASAVYNPDRNEYYDSDVQEWDAEKQQYYLVDTGMQKKEQFIADADPADYVVWDDALQMFVMTGKSIPQGVSADTFFPEVPYNGEIPEELLEVFRVYQDGNAEYQKELAESDPVPPAFQSYLPSDPEGKRDLLRGAYPYRSICCKLAVTDSAYREYAQLAVSEMLDVSVFAEKGTAYQYRMYQAAAKAADAIADGGENLTKEKCRELQKEYGYLIAPALEKAGKTELLFIDPELPCTNLNEILSLASFFSK